MHPQKTPGRQQQSYSMRDPKAKATAVFVIQSQSRCLFPFLPYTVRIYEKQNFNELRNYTMVNN